ncbi:MAG TPA: hypothetical protein DDW50_07155 [Firmicutes bacterium]|jgi:hypothetical protein|nr:hypothetical protein [Bacillota bacterium]
MNGWTVAIVSYMIAIVISFFVAGLIQVMGTILTRFSKNNDAVTETAGIEASADVAPDAAVAAAIVIAKKAAI